MKLFFEFFPIILFFAVFKLKGIYYATAAAMAASVCQITFSYIRSKKVEPMMWVSLGVLAVFGGFTLALHNEAFIKWKPTVLYWIFSAALAVSRVAFGKNLIRGMMGGQLALPEKVWERLNASWSAFFALLGAVNLYVAFHYSTAAWVNFKLFGILGCMLVFVVAQSLVLAPHLEKQPDSPGK